MDKKIEQLETKLAFQELTIEELNSMILVLSTDIQKLKEQLMWLSKKIHSEQLSNIANPADETPPPHY